MKKNTFNFTFIPIVLHILDTGPRCIYALLVSGMFGKNGYRMVWNRRSPAYCR